MQQNSMFNSPDPKFLELFEETKKRITGLDSDIAVGIHKGEIIYHLCSYVNMLKGEVAEVGVYKGGASRIIAKRLPSKTVHLFDTFEGIPYIEDDDYSFKVGDFKINGVDLHKQVKNTLSDCPNVRIYKGIFPNTLQPYHNRTFCFVHADADVYQSTKDICEFFYPRLVVGGLIIFDDYGYKGAAGCKRAVDNFFSDKPEKPVILSTGQAIAFKSYETPEQVLARGESTRNILLQR